MNTPNGKPSHQLDHNDECVGCGTHISEPCHPTCPFETGTYGPAVLLRAAAGRLPEHPAGVGYDISGALFSAALALVGEHEAARAAEDAKQVLTGFLVDQWGPTAEAIRAEVVYRHGLFTDLPGIAHSLYAAAARHDSIDFDTEAFGEFPTPSATRVSPFAVPTHVEAVPMQVEVASPDQECPAWWLEKPQGRHALLLGDPEDGGIAYCGTLPELEVFIAQAQTALHQAKLRQLARSDASDTPPPQPYTVIGGWDHEYDEPMPIGVIAGHHQLTGRAREGFEPWLWVTTVYATDPDHADDIAVDKIAADRAAGAHDAGVAR